MTMVVRALVLVLMVHAALPVHAQSLRVAVSSFDEGNRLFQEGDYSGALGRYRSAVDAGYVSGALYYNMGNAYVRLDEIGQAIRYYEKARRWMPESTELAHNLSIVRERTVDSFSRLPAPFWRPVWDGFVEALSPPGLFFLGLFFYVTAAAALAVQIRRGQSSWRRRVFVLSAVLAVTFLASGFTASYDNDRRVRAVVLDDEVTLLDRPGGGGTDLLVHEGTIVDLVKVRAAWTEVRLPNGSRGWMRTAGYGTI